MTRNSYRSINKNVPSKLAQSLSVISELKPPEFDSSRRQTFLLSNRNKDLGVEI